MSRSFGSFDGSSVDFCHIDPIQSVDSIRQEKLRFDGVKVKFNGCRVVYGSVNDWREILRRIAPSGSNDSHAFVRKGHGLATKRRGRWGCWFWTAEIKHYAVAGGGPVSISLNLNPTCFEAYRAWEHRMGEPSNARGAYTVVGRAQSLAALTLDGRNNFIPKHERVAQRTSAEMLSAALNLFRAEIIANLRLAGVPVQETGVRQNEPGRVRPMSVPRFIVNWRGWRIDRFEQYLELETSCARRATRLGYLDARARFNAVKSQVYPGPGFPQLATDMDRNLRSMSYAVRTNATNNLTVYAKADDVVRIERRWVRGGERSQDRPEIRFSEYQRQGLEGLVNWMLAMTPGSLSAILPVARRLRGLVSEAQDGREKWVEFCGWVATTFFRSNEHQAFVRKAIDEGGFHYPSASSTEQKALTKLLSVGLFEFVEEGARVRGENVVPCAALSSYLATLREVDEIMAARAL